MSAELFMSHDPITVPADKKVAEALEIMCRHGVHNLPVMDSEGQFLGLFGLRNLLCALLPKAATISPALGNLDFLADNLEEVIQVLDYVADQPVQNYLDTDNVIVVRADAPIMEVIRKLYEAPTSLPVVLLREDGTHLLGMISHWDILSKIAVQLFKDKEGFKGKCEINPQDKREM